VRISYIAQSRQRCGQACWHSDESKLMKKDLPKGIL
jgi:hypothetical protein